MRFSTFWRRTFISNVTNHPILILPTFLVVESESSDYPTCLSPGPDIIILQRLTQLEALTLSTNNLGRLDLCPLTSDLTGLNISDTNLTRYCPIRGQCSGHVPRSDQWDLTRCSCHKSKYFNWPTLINFYGPDKWTLESVKVVMVIFYKQGALIMTHSSTHSRMDCFH